MSSKFNRKIYENEIKLREIYFFFDSNSNKMTTYDIFGFQCG